MLPRAWISPSGCRRLAKRLQRFRLAAGFETNSHIGELNAVAVTQQIVECRSSGVAAARTAERPTAVLISPRHQLDLFGRQMPNDQRAVQRAFEHVHFHGDVAGMATAELQLIEMNHRIQQVPARGKAGDLDAALRKIRVQTGFELRQPGDQHASGRRHDGEQHRQGDQQQR